MESDQDTTSRWQRDTYFFQTSIMGRIQIKASVWMKRGDQYKTYTLNRDIQENLLGLLANTANVIAVSLPLVECQGSPTQYFFNRFRANAARSALFCCVLAIAANASFMTDNTLLEARAIKFQAASLCALTSIVTYFRFHCASVSSRWCFLLFFFVRRRWRRWCITA